MDKHEWESDTMWTIEPTQGPFLPLDFKAMKKKEIVAHFEGKIKSLKRLHAEEATKAKTIERFLTRKLEDYWRDD